MWETRWPWGLATAIKYFVSQSMLQILLWLIDANKKLETQGQKKEKQPTENHQQTRHCNITAFQKLQITIPCALQQKMYFFSSGSCRCV